MYSFDSRIRYSEADHLSNLTILSLLDYFQDCAIFHSEDCGVSINKLLEEKITWVLNYWQIDIHRFPKVGENVKITTQPYDIHSFIGFRNFTMEDSSGNILSVANTLWSLINTETLKPSRASADMIERYGIGEKLDMDYTDRKILLPEGTEMTTANEIKVTLFDIDTNNHVNNSQYVKYALKLLPPDAKIKRLRAEYKQSALLNDIIVPQHSCYISGENKIHVVYLNSVENKPYCVIEFTI